MALTLYSGKIPIVTAARTTVKAVGAAVGNALNRSVLMLLVQLVGAFSVLYGISFWSVPAALIVGGLGAIAAIEMQNHSASEPEESPELEQQIRARADAALAKGVSPFSVNVGVPMTPKWMTYVALARKSIDTQ